MGIDIAYVQLTVTTHSISNVDAHKAYMLITDWSFNVDAHKAYISAST